MLSPLLAAKKTKIDLKCRKARYYVSKYLIAEETFFLKEIKKIRKMLANYMAKDMCYLVFLQHLTAF